MAQTAKTAASEAKEERKPLLTLSTDLNPPNTVDIDGKEYKVLSGDHLGREEEARALALFREHDRYQLRLAKAKRVDEGQRASENMYDVRVQLIETLTNIPASVVRKLGMNMQAQLLEVCAKEMGFGDNGQVAGGGAEADVDDDIDDDPDAD